MATPEEHIALRVLGDAADGARADAVLPTACREAARVTGGAVVVLRRTDGAWTRAASTGLDDRPDRGQFLERCRALADRAASRGEPAGEPGSVRALPLGAAGGVHGVLVLDDATVEPDAWRPVTAVLGLMLAREDAAAESARLAGARDTAERRARHEAVRAAGADLARETADDMAAALDLLRAALAADPAGGDLVPDLVTRLDRGLDAVRHLPHTPEAGDPVDVAAVVEEAVEAARPAFAERGVDLRLRAPEGLPPLRVEPAVLRQVCARLLETARTWAPSDGRVRVDVVREGDEIAVRFLARVHAEPGAALDALWTGLADAVDVPFRAARALLARYEGTLESRRDGDALAVRMRLPLAQGRDRRRGPDRRRAA